MVVDSPKKQAERERETDLLFHALSDRTRREIMAKVGQREQSISDLARQYEMSFAAIQKHVTVLEKASLVSKRVDGRRKLVTSNPETLRRATELLARFEKLWTGRIEAIDRLIADEKEAAMTVTSTNPDRENLQLSIVAEFDATPERIWQIWEDPRQLEKWWGPPTWPATFVEHDFREGGQSRYFMTGPEGEKAHGHWLFKELSAPGRIEIEDSFADPNGNPVDSPPAGKMVATIEAEGGKTRMTIVSRFDSIEAMEELLAMGQAEGMTQAMGQIDALLEV